MTTWTYVALPIGEEAWICDECQCFVEDLVFVAGGGHASVCDNCSKIAELEKPRTCAGCRHLQKTDECPLLTDATYAEMYQPEYADVERISIEDPDTFGCNHWEKKEEV